MNLSSNKLPYGRYYLEQKNLQVYIDIKFSSLIQHNIEYVLCRNVAIVPTYMT